MRASHGGGMRVTILGCGGSGGVPLVGGLWGDCDPANPRNRRRRPSILVETQGRRLLVDTSPDLRAQLLDAGVAALDGVLFTHSHADHCHGIDDLRALVYARGEPIDAYTDAATLRALLGRFGYAFATGDGDGDRSGYPPLLRGHAVEVGMPFRAAGVEAVAFAQGHGREPTLGFRIGALAYSPDVDRLDDEAFAALAGVRLWIVDCLSFRPHPTHAHFERTLAWIRRLRPELAVLTHMSHRLDYAEAARRCPPGVEPGYDGMVLEVKAGRPVRAPAAEEAHGPS